MASMMNVHYFWSPPSHYGGVKMVAARPTPKLAAQAPASPPCGLDPNGYLKGCVKCIVAASSYKQAPHITMLKTSIAFVLLGSLISAAPTALDKPLTVPLSRNEVKPAATPEEEAFRSDVHLLSKWPQLLYPEARSKLRAKVQQGGAVTEE